MQKENIRWQANWIFCKGKKSPRNFYLYLRKQLKLEDEVKKALVYVSADSRYKLYINGKFIGRGPARCDPRWQYYDTYDLSKYFHKGKNVIAALVHHYGEGTFSYIPGQAGFLFQTEIEFVQGDEMLIKTDSSWRVEPPRAWRQNVPRVSVHLGFQEVYDACKEIQGWNKVDFDDSNWDEATVLGRGSVSPWTRMVPRDIPMMREQEIFPISIVEVGEIVDKKGRDRVDCIAQRMAEEKHTALSKNRIRGIQNLIHPNGRYALIYPGRDIYFVLDFGKEVVGYPRLSLEGIEGGVIDLGYDEVLIDGRLNPTRGLRCSSKVKYVDRYLMRGGFQTYEVSFVMKGFRYMQVTLRNLTGPIKIHLVSLNFVTYPVEYQGAFLCSEEMLNKIWKVARYTLHLCMHDAYEDCPWREQAQWLGDAQIEMVANYYTFGDTRLAAKALRQIAQSQEKRGITWGLYPVSMDSFTFDPRLPDYSLIWIMALYDYYLYTGDRGIVKELYPNLQKLIRWFFKRLDKDGLLNNIPGWIFIDWAQVDKRGEITVLNCFFYQALLDAAKMAQVNDDRKQAREYRLLAQKVKEAINRYLWSDKSGVYVDCRKGGMRSEVVSAQTNSLALLYNIADKEKRESILSHILEENNLIKVQPYFMYYVLRALALYGKDETGMKIISRYWGKMLEEGATTFWETWDWREHARGSGSLCHGWSIAPVFYLSAEILGVKPIKPGFKLFSLSPKIGNLRWSRGTVPSPKGNIIVSWKRNKKSFQLRICVPQKTTARVAIPKLDLQNPIISINGITVWKSGKAVKEVKGIKKIYSKIDYTIFTVIPGKYVFEER